MDRAGIVIGQSATKQTAHVQPSHLSGLVFLGVVLLQGLHELEHITQALQRFVLDDPNGAGLLGSWIDIEPVHLVYNGSFLLLLALTYRLGWGHIHNSPTRPVVFWLMTFALLFQSYHFIEHLFKIVQFIGSGTNGTPGILGQFFNLVWLHLVYNTIVYVPVLLAFFLGGFYRVTVADLHFVRKAKTWVLGAGGGL